MAVPYTWPVFYEERTGSNTSFREWENGSVDTYPTSTFVSSTLRRARTGWRNGKLRPESYYELGVTKINAMVGTALTLERRAGMHPWYTETFNGQLGGLPFQDMPWSQRPSVDSGLAARRALLQLKGGAANLAVAVAEGNKTLAMLADRLLAVRNLARRVRQGAPLRGGRSRRKRNRRRSNDEIQNLWLELQYGWLPLFSDIHGLVNALGGSLNRDYASCTGSDKAFSAYPYTRTPWGTDLRTGVSCIQTWKQVRRYKFWAKMDSAPLAYSAALGLTNPLEVAWELVPFSFVADWFAPIGNFLSALDSTSGWTFVKGSTVFIEHITQFGIVDSQAGYSDASGSFFVYRNGQCSSESYLVNRSVLTSFPSQGSPSFKNPFSTAHCANALALVVQAFRGK